MMTKFASLHIFTLVFGIFTFIYICPFVDSALTSFVDLKSPSSPDRSSLNFNCAESVRCVVLVVRLFLERMMELTAMYFLVPQIHFIVRRMVVLTAPHFSIYLQQTEVCENISTF